jgi:hypothetical protein
LVSDRSWLVSTVTHGDATVRFEEPGAVATASVEVTLDHWIEIDPGRAGMLEAFQACGESVRISVFIEDPDVIEMVLSSDGPPHRCRDGWWRDHRREHSVPVRGHIRITVRKIWLSCSEAYPCAAEIPRILANLQRYSAWALSG